MGEHPLDRPAWAALTGPQAHLAVAEGPALRFAPAYGLFAAAPDRSTESLQALSRLVDRLGDVAIVEPTEAPPVPGTAVSATGVLAQMVAVRVVEAGPPAFAFETLTDADAPAMLELATLTKPGPFFERTHQLGAFVGVKLEGRLVAMAGERMKAPGFTEVSGVCTHPDFRGRGYAAGLMRHVMAGVRARGETPFLHVYAWNEGAIALYRQLGFDVRRELVMTSLAKA